MVTLNDTAHHNDTMTQHGSVQPQRSTNRSAQRTTINNGAQSGNIPNGITDYLWQNWQTMEERDPYGGTGSTDTPIKQYIWGSYIDECVQLTSYTILGPQSLPAGTYYLLQDLLYRAGGLDQFQRRHR